MKIILVTSRITYVKDNYLHLLRTVCTRGRQSYDLEIAKVVFLDIPRGYILKTGVGLLLIGAPRFGMALLKNLVTSSVNDPRMALLREAGIPWFTCPNINRDDVVARLAADSPDLIVNMRTRNIYKKPVLAAPKIGCINIHHGLLPDNRGTMCDMWAWFEGRPVGFSVHWMNEKIDDGAIIERREVDVSGIRSYIDIPMASSRLEGEALLESIGKIRREGRGAGVPNRTDAVRYVRNPTFSQIQEIRRKGFFL